MFTANSHDTLLCFSNLGKVYWLRVFQLPQAGRQARGRPLVNLLPLETGEQVTAVLPIKGYDDSHIVMATTQGTVKKCALSAFSNQRANGIIAVNLDDDDHLIGVALVAPGDDLLLVSNRGKAVRFAETDVRAMGRTARGVRGIRLGSGDRVISLMVVPGSNAADLESNPHILTSTANGYGKRTPLEDFPRKNRGGMGVIAIKTSPRNGEVVSALSVTEEDEVMLITNGGTLIRTRVEGISIQSRNTQGVRLISVNGEEHLVSVSRVDESTSEEDDEVEVEAGSPEEASEEPGTTIH
jgi:DNA gyrase subunit A